MMMQFIYVHVNSLQIRNVIIVLYIGHYNLEIELIHVHNCPVSV